jgi:peptidoglycan/LPS O-acetylase OafA/YrhL
MAVGAIGAWFAHRRTALAATLTKPRCILAAIAVTLTLPIYTHDAPASIHVAQAIAFTALAIGISGRPRCPWILENRATRFLGDVSYGIYMLHPFVCFAVIRLMKPHWELMTPGISTAIGHAIALGVTIAIAGLSFIAFEHPILRWKKRFTVITSGTDAA